jgi:uncharacterized ferritin-like protein (DUF455 family)
MTLFEAEEYVQQIRSRVATVAPNTFSPKAGLQSAEGQARLLHDLANIELQASELGLRTLREFSYAPFEFRKELTAITIEEVSHFNLCLEGMRELGFDWGAWPVHTQLNDAVSADDSLLERIFIVHCYLEGSGLDAGEIILRKLTGVKNPVVQKIVSKIVHDELAHVSFGTKWFREIATANGLSADSAMVGMMRSMNARNRLPRRGAVISRRVRLSAGFLESEIVGLEKLNFNAD